MSSHREAPEISKDPVADSTDVYAFVSPDKPGTVTLIANYIPLQSPAGGPNFYEFGDDVLYEIHVDNNGDGRAGRLVPVPVPAPRSATRRRSCTTPARSSRWAARTGTAARPTTSPWSRRQSTGSAPGWPARRATSARCPRRTTPRWPPRRCTSWAAGSGCSPGSGPRASTSTSARYSTWPTCGRSSSCTPRSACTCSARRRPGSTPPTTLNVHSIAIQVPVSALTQERPSDHR